MSGTRPYRKAARAAAEGRTRTALLDAAEAAFFAGSSASLEAISTSAGVTKQTLLRHFGSKDGLFEQAFVRDYDRVRAQRLAAPTNDVDGAVDNLVDHYERYGHRALKLGALAREASTQDFFRRAREMHYGWVEHAFGAWLNPLRGAERERLRAALIVTCDVHTWWILAHDLALHPRDVRATLILTIRRLLEEDH